MPILNGRMPNMLTSEEFFTSIMLTEAAGRFVVDV
jgi:hypothetical protein